MPKLIPFRASLERNIGHRHRQPKAGRICSTSVVPEPSHKSQDSPAILTPTERGETSKLGGIISMAGLLCSGGG